MADEQYIPLSVLRSYSPHPDKLDLTGLTQDEITHGIKSSKLPDYIRYKQYLTDTNEALAQLAEMIIQFAVNLGLDPDEALEWARKLQQSISQSEFDSWVATLLDGGPSIFMNTLSELQTTYPNGAAGVALVRETDPAKIYVWNGTSWEDFGDYQGIGLKDGTVSLEKLSEELKTDIENEIYTIRNLAKNGNFTSDEYWSKAAGVTISGGIATLTANGSTQYLNQSDLWTANTDTGNDILVSFEVVENTLVGTGALGFNNVGVDDFSSGENVSTNVGVHTIVHKVRSGSGKDNRISFWLNSGFTSGSIKITNVVVINLTKTFGSKQPPLSYIENLIAENGGYITRLSTSDIMKYDILKNGEDLGTSVIVEPSTTLGRATLTNGTIWDMHGNKNYIGTTDKIKIPYGTKRIRHNFIPYFPSDGTAGYAMYDDSGAPLYGGKSTNIELNGQERYFSVTGYDFTQRHDALYKIQFIFDDEVKSLANKKINFVGDSITWGTNPDTLDVNTTTSDKSRLKPFSETVSELTGALTTNYGWGGRTLAVDRSDGALAVINLIDLEDRIDFDADVVFILIGINDLHTTRELGAFGDTTASTFFGALDILCKKISTNWRVSEGKQVALSTYFDYDREPNWAAWMDAIRTVCKQYAIPVADLMYEGRINPKTDDGELFAYRADGMKDPHPKQAGYDVMGRYYANWLKSHFEI